MKRFLIFSSLAAALLLQAGVFSRAQEETTAPSAQDAVLQQTAQAEEQFNAQLESIAKQNQAMKSYEQQFEEEKKNRQERKETIQLMEQIPLPDGTTQKAGPQTVAPKQHEAGLQRLEELAISGKQPMAMHYLMQYQLGYGNQSNPVPSKILGNVLVEQPDKFVEEFQKLPANQRIALMPYVSAGWQKATYGKNVSDPKYARVKQQIDALKASLPRTAANRPKPGELNLSPILIQPPTPAQQ